MIDLRSWPKEWNAAALRAFASLTDDSAATLKRLATLPEVSADTLRRLVPFPGRSSPRGWPLVGMFTLGLVAGAMGFYAVTKRAEIARVAKRALSMDDELSSFGEIDSKPVSVTTHRSNHRRKAESEVTK